MQMLIVLPQPPLALPAHVHLEGTILPRGFFLGLGLIYLAALALDRLAEHLRVPSAVAILLLGLALPSAILAQAQPISPIEVETLHRVSLALLIFYAGLSTDLSRIRGMVATGLRLGTLGALITLLITGLALLLLRPALAGGLPLEVVWLVAACLVATDSGALEDLLAALGPRVSERLRQLLQFEAALSTLTALLSFGFLAGVFQGHGHSGHEALHGAFGAMVRMQLGAVALHLLAGLTAGALVGGLATLGRSFGGLVRSEQQLLLVAISLAFVAYGLGQLLGGGGLMAVFTAGVFLTNTQAPNRFPPHALERVQQPFNTAAEITVLLLLGLLVKPEELLTVLPLGVPLTLVLIVARWAGVWAVLPNRCFSSRDRRIVAVCGIRGAVPLALAVSLSLELPHLRGLSEATAEPLSQRLLALIFAVVLIDLLLKSVLMRLYPGSGVHPQQIKGPVRIDPTLNITDARLGMPGEQGEATSAGPGNPFRTQPEHADIMRQAVLSIQQLVHDQPDVAAVLRSTTSTDGARKVLLSHGIEISNDALWRHRGSLFKDGQPTWRG